MNLSASLMCADAGHFAEEVAKLEAAGIDSFHIDIMDGLFVKNFALSWAEVGLFRRLTDLPLEVHLMVNDFEPHIEFARKYRVEKVFIHCEHPKAQLAYERLGESNICAGIALNPDTSVQKLSPYKDSLREVLVMRVMPGFSGQKSIPGIDARVNEIKGLSSKVCITVDGAVTFEKIQELGREGVDGFVLGTSVLFGSQEKYSNIVKKIKS